MKNKLSSLLVFTQTLLLASSAFAGAGYIIDETTGSPYIWDNSSAISIHPESGVCGSFSNSEMITKLQNNIGEWDTPTSSDISFTIVEGSVGDITSSNYPDFLFGVTGASSSAVTIDNINPIIFDNDGQIIEAVAGTGARFTVLGFANPVSFNTSSIKINEAQAVFNCRCLTGNENGACASGSVEFTEDDLDFTMIHELGHFLGLDHSQVNRDIYEAGLDNNGDSLPTMYPISINPAEQTSLQQDDITTISSLYPSSTFNSSFCTVTGTLLDSSGNELRCADVWATSVTTTETDGTITSFTGDPTTTVGFVSGAYAKATDNNGDGYTSADGECTSDCGDFVLYLTPGTAYNLKVMPIKSSFTGGSSLSPCGDSQLSTISAETLGTISSRCSAGATLPLGNLTADESTGGVDSTTGSSTGSSTGSTGTTTSTTSACSLTKNKSSSSSWTFFVSVMLSILFLVRTFKKNAKIR